MRPLGGRRGLRLHQHDDQGDVEGQDGEQVEPVGAVLEEVQLGGGAGQPQEVLGGEPDGGEGLEDLQHDVVLLVALRVHALGEGKLHRVLRSSCLRVVEVTKTCQTNFYNYWRAQDPQTWNLANTLYTDTCFG